MSQEDGLGSVWWIKVLARVEIGRYWGSILVVLIFRLSDFWGSYDGANNDWRLVIKPCLGITVTQHVKIRVLVKLTGFSGELVTLVVWNI